MTEFNCPKCHTSSWTKLVDGSISCPACHATVVVSKPKALRCSPGEEANGFASKTKTAEHTAKVRTEEREFVSASKRNAPKRASEKRSDDSGFGVSDFVKSIALLLVLIGGAFGIGAYFVSQLRPDTDKRIEPEVIAGQSTSAGDKKVAPPVGDGKPPVILDDKRRGVGTGGREISIVDLIPAPPTEPTKAESNRKLIEDQAATILFLAHPTTTFTGVAYEKTVTYYDGSYRLNYRFTFNNFFNKPIYRNWEFVFTNTGSLYGIADGTSDADIAPFTLLNTVLIGLKIYVNEQIKNGDMDANDLSARLILDAPDGRTMTVKALQLVQIGQDVGPFIRQLVPLLK